jgi:DeoR family fructose operon transcriptional repressor
VRYSDAPARRAALLKRLEEQGYVSSAQLADEFGVSEMTIRRDLAQLHSAGLARRVTGGASLGRALPFDARDREESAGKRAIARACAELIGDVATVALDAGTTVAPLASFLPPAVRVVSHSVPVISACAERDDIDLIGIGGVYQRSTRSFAGPAAQSAVKKLAVDIAVLSATAVGPVGIYSASALDCEMKREYMRISERRVLVADHTKLGQRAPFRLGGLPLVDTVITDSGATPWQLGMLHEAGVRVIVAPGEATAE